MKKKLFNIHKLIGVNVILFFFLSLFFGILTIFQPYINLWEDSAKHIKHIEMKDIDLEKCLKQVTKRKYFQEDGSILKNDMHKLRLPAVEVTSNNLLRVTTRPNFYLDPNTCIKVKAKRFNISSFFDTIHRGRIFNSFIMRILFGFMSVAVVFLCLSGIYLIIKNNYRNTAKSTKSHFAKYHRLLLLYTLPLIFMFGLTGALFNLGVYSTPLMTHYLTNGETINVLKVDKNVLNDVDLKIHEKSLKMKNMNLNELYTKAVDEFDDIRFYSMQIYNYQDINAKVKFIGYEPHNFFISSMINESYIVLDANNAEVLDKKMAADGTFTEKTLDAIFYLHYLRTFQDIPRIIFAIISMIMLVGLVYAMNLWLERAKKDKFSYKVLKPLSLSIILGSLVSASLLFAITWIIPKDYTSFILFDKLQVTHRVFFYLTYFFMFIYVFIKKEPISIIRNSFYISSALLMIAFFAHNFMSGFTIFRTYNEGMYEIFGTDIALLLVSIVLFIFAKRLPEKYIEFK